MSSTLTDRIGLGMSRAQRGDRVALEQQIERTEKHLAQLRQELADSEPPATRESEETAFLSQEEIEALLVDGSFGDDDQDAERFDGMS